MVTYEESGWENPPLPVDGAEPTALQSESFEGDEYGVLGAPAKNAEEDRGKATKFADGAGSVVTKSGDGGVTLRTRIRELVVYFSFLAVLSILVFMMCSSSTFYFNKLIGDLFTVSKDDNGRTFKEAAKIDDIWAYLENQLMTGLYWDEEEMGETPEKGMVFYENMLIGRPRLRQVKVRNDSCEVVEAFRREIKECFGAYRGDREETRPFGPAEDNGTDTIYTAFTYQDAAVLENSHTWGTSGQYGGGGYQQLLSIDDAESTAAAIKQLKANRWIDRGTRAVFIDFALYNANINMFCFVQLIFEVPATGGVIPSSHFDTLSIIRSPGTWSTIRMICEGIFCAFVVFFVVEEFVEICKWRLRYFMEFWNLIDLTVISLSVVCIVCGVRNNKVAAKRMAKLFQDELTWAPLDDVVQANALFTNIAALVVFFSWIKIFKYISFNKTMSQLSSTLSRSAKDIGGFGVMFIIFFFAYAQFGYLVFGTQIADYSSFYGAVLALFRLILGDFDFHALENANRVLGPLFFLTYVFFVFFVLLNMFLAIINDSYVEVKRELEEQKRDFEVADFVTGSFYRVLRFLHLTRPAGEVEADMQFDAWKDKLKKRGYTNEEIEASFARHDVSEKKMMNDEDKAAVEEDLERMQKNKVEKQGDIILSKRVNLVEGTMKDVAKRVETVLDLLNTIEEKKVQAAEERNSILYNKHMLGKSNNSDTDSDTDHSG